MSIRKEQPKHVSQYIRLKNFIQSPFSLKDNINLLIIVHLVAFVSFAVSGAISFLGAPYVKEGMHRYLRSLLALSVHPGPFRLEWITGIFTYQFVHFRVGELLFSLTALWLFGHILQRKASQTQIVLFYFLSAGISAIVFYLSHLIFPIFSQPEGIMYGAFGGVLSVMTATVFLFGKVKFRLSDKHYVYLWQIYALALLLSLALVYKNNMAYILVYACNFLMGIRYGMSLKNNATKELTSLPTRRGISYDRIAYRN